MKAIRYLLLPLLALSSLASAAEGMITLPSAFNVTETADRLEKAVAQKGMKLFNRHSHSMAAKGVEIELRDTELLLFGNPKAGSPLMKCQQSIGIDLPQKALIWQDQAGKVWLSYNDPEYLKARHKVTGCDPVFTNIGRALAHLAKTATQE